MKISSRPPTILLLSGALTWFAGCARTERAQTESASKSTAPPQTIAPSVSPAELPAASLDGNTRGWAAGKSYSYEMKLRTMVDFEGAGNNFDFDIVGTLEVAPATVVAGSATIQARIPDARIVSRIPGSQGELDKLAAEIRSCVAWFELTGGRAGALFVPSGTSQMAASTYRHVASALQFARPNDGATRYSAEEHDTTGKYVAEYSLGAKHNVWQKRKARYLSLLGADALPVNVRDRVTPEVVSSRGEIRLSADGRPLAVRLSDELTLKGAQVPLASRASIELDALEERPRVAQLDIAALLAKSTRYRADEPIRDPHASDALDEAKMGGLDFAKIAERLERSARERQKAKPVDPTAPAVQTEKTEQEVHEDSRLFHALAAVFRNEPGATEKAVARVRAGSPAVDAFVDALGDAATPDAHRALAKILSTAAVNGDVVARVVLSLARTPKPTPAASEALKAVLKQAPHNPSALYGLGTHSRLYRDEGKAKEAAELGDFLVARFKRGDGPMTTTVLLRAIANSGYIGALPQVLPFLKHKDEEIRGTAVRALQSMRGQRVDDMIAGLLKEDDSAEVRISAIEAAKVREPTEPVVAALIDAGTHGESPHVRYRAVELMANWLQKRPELRATLDLVAKNDEEEKIREKAKAAL